MLSWKHMHFTLHKIYLLCLWRSESIPFIRPHMWTSRDWMVTRLPWIARSFTWVNIRTKCVSAASWRARRAVDWNLHGIVGYRSLTTSRTRRWNENFRINNSVDFWYFLISRRATVPGRYLLRLRIDPECRCRRVFPSPVTALDDVLVRVISRTIRNNW